MGIVPEIGSLVPDMKTWRHHLHAHPETAFEETATSAFVADKLRSFGLEVHTGLAITGVVGVLHGAGNGNAIGLRADLDALHVLERTGVAHRSRHQGKMHACGHDGHTTMLLGAAKYLAETRNFDGTVNFIFQPAEEGMGGAKAMVDDGLFDKFPCDSIFGMHNRPSVPVGKFNVKPGPMMAGGAFFDIFVTGKGAHGARPESGVDSALVAAQIAVSLQSIVSRNVRPIDTAVVSVTKIHAGDAYNVIPQTAHLGGTARAFSPEVMAKIESSMKRIAKGVAESHGATAEVDFRVLFAPTVNN